MADHARAQELAAVSIDFDLTVAERAELDLHLQDCPSCRSHLDGLLVDARAVADFPRLDAPARVRRRIAPDPRPAWGSWPRLAGAMAVVAVVIAIVAETGGVRFDVGVGTGAVQPTSLAAASSPPAAGSAPAAGSVPAVGAAPTPRPDLPTTAWVVAGGRPAFDPTAVTPKKDTSSPPPLTCKDCGDTSVTSRSAVVRAAVETDAGIVAVGHGCVGDSWVTCRADVWVSADAKDWQAVPYDKTLDAGADVNVNRPTGMTDVVAGPQGIVAGGTTSRARRMQATMWTSPDGLRWQPIALDHEGDGTVAAVAAGPTTLVAVGRVRTDDGVTAAVWASSDGTTWQPAELDDAAVGQFDEDEQDVAGMFDVTWAGDRFVAVGAACSDLSSCRTAAWTSLDGRSWTRATKVTSAGRMRSVAYLGSTLVAVGDDGTWENARGRAWTSADATDWIPAAITTDGAEGPPPLRAVVATGAGAIAAGDGYAVQSSDGRSWTRSDDGALARGSVFGLAAGLEGIIATGQGEGAEVGGTWQRPPAVWILPYR